MLLTQFTVKRLPESLEEERNRLSDREVLIQLARQRRHSLALDAARDDVIVPRKVGVTVDGDTVHRHQVGDMDADRRHLAIPVDPDTRVAVQDADPFSGGSLTGQMRRENAGARLHHGCLDRVDVAADAAAQASEVSQVQDRVGDQLSCSVECDQPTTVRANKVRSQGPQALLLLLRVLASPDADRVDRRMFHEDQSIGVQVARSTSLDGRLEPLVQLDLDRQCIRVRQATQVDDSQQWLGLRPSQRRKEEERRERERDSRLEHLFRPSLEGLAHEGQGSCFR